MRQMKSKLVGGQQGSYLGGLNIESVDEDQASGPSSGRSGRYRGGRRPQSARSRGGGSSDQSGASSRGGGSPPKSQNPQQQAPNRFVKFGGIVGNNENPYEFQSANPA